jgi:hypothetical protein
MLRSQVLAPADEALSIRCERQAGHVVSVTGEVIDELPRVDIPEAHDSVTVACGDYAPVRRDGDGKYMDAGLHIARPNEHNTQHTQASISHIFTMTCISSLPYTMISTAKTHVCDRQRLVLPGLHVPDAHSIVQGAGQNEAGVT